MKIAGDSNLSCCTYNARAITKGARMIRTTYKLILVIYYVVGTRGQKGTNKKVCVGTRHAPEVNEHFILIMVAAGCIN